MPQTPSGSRLSLRGPFTSRTNGALRAPGVPDARAGRGYPKSRRSSYSPRRRLSSWLSRNRRLTVALLLCVATGIAVQQLTPASEQRTSVLVAARDLAAGTSITPADFTSVGVPTDFAVSGALTDPALLAGRQLASPLAKGQVPTEANLLGPGLLTGAPAGSAAVPLRMADPSSIQLLSPGQLVTVILTATEAFDDARGSEVLAGPVPVLWTSVRGGQAGQWLGTSDTEGLVVVAADPQQAEKLAGASTQGKLFFVLVNP
ncbi:Flp pilus assembly protein CpaB [Paenarthrobacter sp. NPDC089322]|uniref:Flp pilus assembly protein CpaB n=1 Tax=Paenarthrobacter sp. NPDC089322 TaxID=3155065 RepID=UPI00341201CF